MKKSTSNGIGLPGVLFVVFLVLKLTGNIDWSWWWVTSPIWIPLVVGIAILLTLVIVFIGMLSIGYTIEDLKDKFKLWKDKSEEK
jgi:multidrug efflux pump subunit AcrB